MKFFGLDKVAKLGNIIKQHGGLKASLYHLYRTDDLKVRLNELRFLIFIFLPHPRLEDLLEKTSMAINISRMTNISTEETDGSSIIPSMELTTMAAWFLLNGGFDHGDSFVVSNDDIPQVWMVALQD